MFKTQLAFENWKSKYSFNGEQPILTWQRVAKALASVEENPEDYYGLFLRTMVKFNDETNEPEGLKATTGGRITANAGTSYDGATLINCFSGDTEYLTNDGIKSFRDTVGTTQSVVSNGGYFVDGKVNALGKQPLNKIVFKPCSIDIIYRNNKTGCLSNKDDDNSSKQISYRAFRRSDYKVEEFATLHHKWELIDGSVTARIKIGEVIPSNAPKFDVDEEKYKDGLRHGIIFGDGSVEYKYVDTKNIRYRVRLCGTKSKYKYLFDDVKSFDSCGDDPVCFLISENMLKELPCEFEKSYIKGFIDGYIAMDGSVLTKKSKQLSSTKKDVLEWVKCNSIYSGYISFDVKKDKIEDTNLGSRKLYRLNMTKAENVVWKVVDIYGGIAYDNVYCLDVPEKHRFTLSHGIFTSNCYINGPVKKATISYKRRNSTGEFEYPVKIKTPDTGDNLHNIFLTILEQARTLASEGGYGLNFSFIRPRSSIIKGIGIKHPGVPSYMNIWDAVSECIVQGDTDGYRDKIKNYLSKDEMDELSDAVKGQARKGAMMGVLNIWHPDIEEFIRVKQTAKKLTKFNLSVAVDNKFMQAVEDNDFYDLVFEGKIYKRVKARDLYNTIMESTYNRGEPGILFVDNMHSNNPISYLGRAECTNPCVRKGSLTVTDKGLFPVEDIKLNVNIQNTVGFGVLADIEVHESEPIYRVTFSDGFYQDVTMGHIYHSQKCGGDNRKKWNNELRLSDLNIGDYVRKDRYRYKLPNDGDAIYNRDIGLLAGLYLGDGYIDAHDNVVICLNSSEDNSFVYELAERLGCACWNDETGEGDSIKILIGGKLDLRAKRLLENINLNLELDCNSKTFPYQWLNTNNEFIRGLIDGLISSDGNVNLKSRYPQVRYKGNSVDLHLMIHHLMLYVGADYKFYLSGKVGDKSKINGREIIRRHSCYEGIIENDSIYNLFQFMDSISHVIKNDLLRDIVKNYSLSGVKWKTKIKSIEAIGLDTVYDLHEPIADDWNVGGIVSRGCGEIPGLADLTTVCLLGSLNVTQYVRLNRTFDFDLYIKDVETFTRMLDNVNDLAKNPLPSYDWAVKNFRQIGMGLNGLGSALLMMGIPYNSKEAIDFTKKLCQLKEDITWRASAMLAKEKGVFPAYDKDKFENTEYFKSDRLSDETKRLIRKNGVRNAKTTTNPPLGNSSVICDNVSNGIEPVISLEYERIRIIPNWPEGLNQDNVTDILKEYKKKDYVYWRGDYNGTIYHYEPHNRGLCDVTVVRDYGWQWLLDNVDDEIRPNDVVTMSQLSVDDHLAIQEVVQYYCNQSVSKCLVENQEIRTNFGYIKIIDAIDSSIEIDGEGFYKCKDGLKVYNENGDYIDVDSFYYGGTKPSYRISFNNGMSIDFAENHLVETINGLVKTKDICKDDIVNYKEYNLEMVSGGLPIIFSDDIFYNCIKRQFPKKVSVKFAKLLGMLISDGDIGKYSFSLTEKDSTVSKVYDGLCMDIFNIKPSVVIDKRNGVRSRGINSKPICSILHDMIGNNAFCKKIPHQILNGSNDEKMAVLEGISLDGYYISDRNKLCLYNGVSEILAKQIFNISVDLFGINSCYYGYSKIKGYDHNSYYVMIDKSIKCIESHKNKVVNEWKRFVIIDKDEILNKKMNYKDKNYNSFINLKRRLINKGQGKVSKFVADKLGLKYKSILYVTKNEYIGLKRVCDIAVKSDSHLYLVSNVITHNTVNLPKNYSFTGFKSLYMDAWKRGLNGLATYREGSMESVISSIEEAESTREIIKTDIKLPETFLNGPTSIITKEGIKFYINFSYLPEDSDMKFPICMWIYTNAHPKGQAVASNKAVRELAKLAIGCGIASKIVDATLEKANNDEPHNKLGRMISLCLRHNIPRERIYVSLSDIEGDNISSLLTAVRKYISNTIADGTVLDGLKCPNPECGSDNYVIVSGCKQCRDCGYSACG